MTEATSKSTPSFEGIDAVLLDIEGTICPITFVKDVLFPYALKGLPKVLKEKWDAAEFRPYRDAFPEGAQQNPLVFEAHVQDLTERDVKVAYLKNLQGYLWQEGYASGAYATPLFADVVPQLQRWHDAGVQISIYSSGSVFAQKLLFAHVKDTLAVAQQDGDLAAVLDLQYLITDWFDTTNAGPKKEEASYSKIVKALGKTAGTVLFLSDNVKEVQAALEAGMKSVVLDRPGNAPLTEEDRDKFQVVTSLDEISVHRASMKDDDKNRKRKRKSEMPDEVNIGGVQNGDDPNSAATQASNPAKKVRKERNSTMQAETTRTTRSSARLADSNK